MVLVFLYGIDIQTIAQAKQSSFSIPYTFESCPLSLIWFNFQFQYLFSFSISVYSWPKERPKENFLQHHDLRWWKNVYSTAHDCVWLWNCDFRISVSQPVSISALLYKWQKVFYMLKLMVLFVIFITYHFHYPASEA